MSRIPKRGRRAAGAIVMAAAALVIGAVFGSAGNGRAAASAAPVNTGTPTISGVAQEGQTLTGSDGTWSNSPTSYTYAWSRCDANGNSCATIAGATLKTYQLTSADVTHTVRLTVTAKNADGSASATSVPSAVVANANAPKNTALPAISGTLGVGDILSVSKGTWSGSPTGYSYAWSRCDANGNACAKIGGADGPQYKLTAADAGTTVRATVTATNGTGSTSATSAQSGVVPTPTTPVPTGCPAGTGTVQASQLALPARMSVDQQTVSPGVITLDTGTIQVHARVTACGGRPVQGALVLATAVPYNQFQGSEVPTGADGTVTISMSRQAGFPATAHQERLALFMRARKPSGQTLAGVSTRRLVTFPVQLR